MKNDNQTKPTASAAKRQGALRGKPQSKAGKKSPRQPLTSTEPQLGSQQVAQRIHEIGGWRGQTLAHVRALIQAAVPDVVEEIKCRKPSNDMAGVPVWSHHGIICTGESYAKVVKLTFARGASLPDPHRLFNSSLEGATRRAIDIAEGKPLNAAAFRALIIAASALNESPAGSAKANARNKPRPKASSDEARRLPAGKNGVVLLSGGNPQIAKADGDAPVQAYIAAMPGWKSDLGKRLDALIERSVPNVHKAVRWNSPFYGVEGRGWFLSFHVFTRYVKVTFFKGAALQPVPPGAGKDQDARWIDIYEGDDFDQRQLAIWFKQAAAIPGWQP